MPCVSDGRLSTKERFTLPEMYALVEGMEMHGLKWSQIKKDFKDLEHKTQGDLKDKVNSSVLRALGGIHEGLSAHLSLSLRWLAQQRYRVIDNNFFLH